MANRFKGEIEATTGHRMVFDFNAMAEFEDITGVKGGDFLNRLPKGETSISELRAFYLACLKRHNPEMSLMDAGDVFSEDAEAWQRILAAAFPEQKEVQASGNAKARPKKTAG